MSSRLRACCCSKVFGQHREPNLLVETGRSLIRQNPIVTADRLPFNCRGVFNRSVVKHEGRYVMVLRCEGYNFYDFFALAS